MVRSLRANVEPIDKPEKPVIKREKPSNNISRSEIESMIRSIISEYMTKENTPIKSNICSELSSIDQLTLVRSWIKTHKRAEKFGIGSIEREFYTKCKKEEERLLEIANREN